MESLTFTAKYEWFPTTPIKVLGESAENPSESLLLCSRNTNLFWRARSVCTAWGSTLDIPASWAPWLITIWWLWPKEEEEEKVMVFHRCNLLNSPDNSLCCRYPWTSRSLRSSPEARCPPDSSWLLGHGAQSAGRPGRSSQQQSGWQCAASGTGPAPHWSAGAVHQPGSGHRAHGLCRTQVRGGREKGGWGGRGRETELILELLNNHRSHWTESIKYVIHRKTPCGHYAGSTFKIINKMKGQLWL